MLKGLMHNIVLRIQARTGVTSTFFIGSAIAACALLVVFVFLCVTGYAWLSVQLGAVFGGLAMAGVFLLVALVGIAVACQFHGVKPSNAQSLSGRLRLRGR